MEGRTESGRDDHDAVDTVVLELVVLDRLLYRNRSQHRSAKYFNLVLEVRRACRTMAAPKLLDLLARGLGLLARVPDSRNSRARDAWLRSAAAELRRIRAATLTCATALEATVRASRHLAHQVSQTYFMALSVVLLACLARLFVCNLHLGGRLLEVHGALLRAMLAQPCTSECLSSTVLAACRIPEETLSFLSRLRGAGGAQKASWMKAPKRTSSPAAAVAARGSLGSAITGSSSSESTGMCASAVIGKSTSKLVTAKRTAVGGGAVGTGEGDILRMGDNIVGSGGDDGDSDDDSGVRVGRVGAVELVDEGNTSRRRSRVAMEGKVPMVADAGGGARATATVDGGRAGEGAGGEGWSVAGGFGGQGEPGGGNKDGGARRFAARPSVQPFLKKKIVLACEFSDSSDDDDNGSDREPLPLAAAAPTARAATESVQSASPSSKRLKPAPAFFLSMPTPPQPPRRQPTNTSVPMAGDVAIGSASSSSGGGSAAVAADASAGDADRASTPQEAEATTQPQVGWMIDRGPASSETGGAEDAGRRGLPSKTKSSRKSRKSKGKGSSILGVGHTEPTKSNGADSQPKNGGCSGSNKLSSGKGAGVSGVEHTKPTKSRGAGDQPKGGGSGSKRLSSGKGRGETKKKRKQRVSKGSASGEGGGKDTIDDIFGSLF